ncbi:MAG: hypothetical protein Q8T11_08600 [Elusimicrobiota bacterium]|nr:hypothetical protein [Elusimicrobiota bacterium]
MEEDRPQSTEEQTFSAYNQWVSEGRRVRVLFERMGFPIPLPLKSALGQGAATSPTRVTRIPPPERPNSPTQAKGSWQWLPVAKASVRTVFLSILNEGKPLLLRDIADRIQRLLPKSNPGSVYNIPAQISEKIEKVGKEWRLKAGQDAPILYSGYVWAPREQFQATDLAEIRRLAIAHLLSISSGGLQIMQIYNQLKEGADWLDTPNSKDLIKTDLAIMKGDGIVKRVGNSNKWTLVEKQGS